MYGSPTDARKRPDVIVCFIIVPLNNTWFSVTYFSNEDSSHLGLQFSVLYLHCCVEDFLENTLDNCNNKLVVCAKNEFTGVFKRKWTFTTNDGLGMLEDDSLLEGLILSCSDNSNLFVKSWSKSLSLTPSMSGHAQQHHYLQLYKHVHMSGNYQSSAKSLCCRIRS